jgi:hypothetical protein
VVGDVGERKPFDATPPLRFEDLRDHGPIVADVSYPPMPARRFPTSGPEKPPLHTSIT